jgi:RimJ/RimL family protein N-acetyltransferase
MIETERLLLRPLTYGQLVSYARCDGSLEEELGVRPSSRTVSAELREALEQTILPNVAQRPENYLYHTLWTAISKAHNSMVGDLCIVGEPNAAGGIEIGYGTYDAFQGQGFMTEMVGGIIVWATAQPAVRAIIASTDRTNTASFRVLQKNGFITTGETGDTLHWKLQLHRPVDGPHPSSSSCCTPLPRQTHDTRP